VERQVEVDGIAVAGEVPLSARADFDRMTL
jgi:hypothetical protein